MGTVRIAYLADFIPTHGSKQTHKSPSSVVVGVSTNENPLCDMRSRMKSAFGAIIILYLLILGSTAALDIRRMAAEVIFQYVFFFFSIY